LQLSATTGTLENSVTLPSMPAGVFAANDDGFFIGPGEFYKNGQEIYRVSPGASHAQLLRQVPGPMSWMYGFTHMMFAQVRFDYAAPCERGACHLWRFVGAAAAATIMNSSVPSAEQQPVGNANVGILAIEPSTSAPYPRAVVEIRIDPENGTKTILARLSVSKDQFVESSAYLAGSLYVLVEGRLFRVPVRPLYR
jgi:hypothetical protein